MYDISLKKGEKMNIIKIWCQRNDIWEAFYAYFHHYFSEKVEKLFSYH